MLSGTVKWFDVKKGYGFILSPDGKDVFVHFTSIECDGFRTLKDDEKVQYELVQGDKGMHAEHVKRARSLAHREPQKATA
jgi:CspA family cold shock protein